MATSLSYSGSGTIFTGDPIPLQDGSLLFPSTTHRQTRRERRSKVMKFDAAAIGKVPEFQYRRLTDLNKRIRLLRLKSGTLDNPQIDCELFEAEYDDDHRKLKEKSSNDMFIGDEAVGYEALSWNWGKGDQEYAIMIRYDGRTTYKKRVSRDLALALKYLRLADSERTLWIDAICINQADYEERNHQVQMMSLIYTQAKQVCVWLGEDTDESQLAIRFIKDEIMKLENFEDVCSNKKNAEKWQSLLVLMQRPWFSRRWVVQEIALASKATVYCGEDQIPWKSFAVAVELFVEVETATHRLSEVMQKDERFYHVPGWFEYVSELGASLLVSATAKIFRQYKSRADEPLIGPTSKRGLLSLEYLVSTLCIFEATKPHDTIYSLLAIARDTAPVAELPVRRVNDTEALLRATFGNLLEKKPYTVDYNRSYADVCKDFVSFCIGRSWQSDPARALDILCRPWAPVAHVRSVQELGKRAPGAGKVKPRRDSQRRKDNGQSSGARQRNYKRRKNYKSDPESVSTKAPLTGTNSSVDLGKILANGLQKPVRDTGSEGGNANHHPSLANDDESEKTNSDLHTVTLEEDPRSMSDYMAQAEQFGPVREEFLQRFPKDFDASKAFTESQQSQENNTSAEMDLPSWVARIDDAPFGLFPSPGMHLKKLGRKNADPLVGPPEDGHKNYNAAQSKGPCMKTLKFRKRSGLKTYSLYVKGFILDEVQDVAPYSQGGAIPKDWFKLGGWDSVTHDDLGHRNEKSKDEEDKDDEPPPEFWRTLVADRGKDNRNPPYYYAKACQECVSKGSLSSGRVNVDALINNEKNSIIAEFCRRVQAVIWNRKMIRTKNGTLGLVSQHVEAGDLVCIIYGCTVPVILRQNDIKGLADVQKEAIEDGFEALNNVVRNCEDKYIRKVQYSRRGDEATRSLIKRSTTLIGEESDAWNDRRKFEKKQDEEARKRRNEVHQAWLEEREAHGQEQDKKNGNEDGNEEVQAPPWTRYLDQESRRRLEEVFNTYESSGQPVSDLSRSSHSSSFGESLGEKVKLKIRDLHSSYRFMGESYIHGMMDGEAMREKFINSIPEQIFELK